MEIKCLKNKRNPVGYINIDAAISIIGAALHEDNWSGNPLVHGEPFYIVKSTYNPATQQVTRTIVKHKKKRSNPPQTYRETETITEEQAKAEEAASSMIYTAYDELIKHCISKKIRFIALTPDGTYHKSKDIPDGAWLTQYRRIAQSGYIRLVMGYKSVFGRLLFLEADVIKSSEKIKGSVITKLHPIRDSEMQQLRNYVITLVQRVQREVPELCTHTRKGNQRILIDVTQCANYLKALSHAHNWKFNEKMHFDNGIKKHEDGNFLKNLGLNMRGKMHLPDREKIAANFIAKLQQELCAKISERKKHHLPTD